MTTPIENAFQIYEAAFDSACDFKPNKDNFAETVEHVCAYAANALDTYISKDVAEKITQAYFDYQDATWGESGNGEYSNNFYRIVEEPLSEIKLFNIEVVISSYTLGENTAEMNKNFISAVEKALIAEYPHSDIDVTLTDNATQGSVYVNGDASGDHAENVNYIINKIWGDADY